MEREQWLLDMCVTENDVIQDEDGREFIITENENGTAGDDDYQVENKKVFLPESIQNI